jgi:hypothetical protein
MPQSKVRIFRKDLLVRNWRGDEWGNLIGGWYKADKEEPIQENNPTDTRKKGQT